MCIWEVLWKYYYMISIRWDQNNWHRAAVFKVKQVLFIYILYTKEGGQSVNNCPFYQAENQPSNDSQKQASIAAQLHQEWHDSNFEKQMQHHMHIQ